MNRHDLLVVGGGPAGTAAAITAARRGLRVLLLERGRLPRHKVCGEFVSAEALGLLRSLLGERATLLDDAPAIARSRVFLDGRVLEAPLRPPAASLPRYDLDLALWEAATAAGADGRQQTPVTGITGDGPFTARTPAGEFAARAVLDASGRWSSLRPARATGGSPEWLGLKAHFSEPAAPSAVDLYFFSGGYCGVQPVGHGRVNVCALVRAVCARSLPEVFRLHPQLEERSRGWSAVMHPIATAPVFFAPPVAVRGGVLCAGDAAGFVDPFVGDGIALALRGGVLAAAALAGFLAGDCPLAAAARRYRADYRRLLAPVFSRAALLRRLTMLPQPVRRPILHLLRLPRAGELLVQATRSRA